MEGKSYEAGIFAHLLRKMLFLNILAYAKKFPAANSFLKVVDHIGRSTTGYMTMRFPVLPLIKSPLSPN